MLVLVSVFSASAFAIEENEALQILETRLRQVTPVPKGIFSGSDQARANLRKVEAVNAVAENSPATVCKISRTAVLGTRYMLSMDAQGAPCRIADLSFPTLIGARHKIAELPTQKMTAKDYLAFIDGRYDEVYNRVEHLKANFDQREAATASWVSKVRFRGTPTGLAARKALGEGGLPASFRASDLEVGAFQFSMADRMVLKRMVSEVQEASGLKANFGVSQDPLMQLADNPNKLLENIRFDWNDLRKVYEIAIEGEFLPLKAPVVLIDFERPHKQAVEAILRKTLASLMLKLVGLIPEPFTQSIVDVAVTDASNSWI